MRFVCGVSDETALRLLKWSEFFLMFMLIIPVAVLLYQDKGITLGDFFLIQGLFRIAAFALEIPSGFPTFSAGERFCSSERLSGWPEMSGCILPMAFGRLPCAKCLLALPRPYFPEPKRLMLMIC